MGKKNILIFVFWSCKVLCRECSILMRLYTEHPLHDHILEYQCIIKNESLGSPGPSGQQLRFQAVTAPGCERHPRRRAGALATLCCLCEAASANLHEKPYAETRSGSHPPLLVWRALPAEPNSSHQRVNAKRSATSCHFLFFFPFTS